MSSRYRSFFLGSLASLAVLLVTACGGGGGGSSAPPAPSTPAITSFVPASGRVGDGVVLSGNGFNGSTAVTFNGIYSTFSVGSDTQITTFVPALAQSGPITVSAPSGTLTSSSSFTVLPSIPIISGFSLNPATIGASVKINGKYFSGATSVTIGGMAVGFSILSDTQIQITVPSSTWIGGNTIVVITPGGSATSNPGLSIAYPALSITGFSPTSGASGTTVNISGQGFLGTTAVTFNGMAAPTFTVNSATQITATVPGGASSGFIHVTNGTTIDSAVPFLVTVSAPTLDLNIDGAYITQSTQTYSSTVPLVQNRDGFLRVFPKANLANAAAPAIRVRIFDGGTNSLLYTYTINAPTSVPTTIHEETLTASWNKTIAGSQIQAGRYLTLELDPANAVAETNKANNLLRYPASGNLDIRAVKVFATTVIPVKQSGLTGNVDSGRVLADWTDRFQRMYPIQNLPAGINIQKGATYETTANLNNGSSAIGDAGGWGQLLDEIEAKRQVEASTRYYYGAVNVSYSGGTAGLGFVGNPSAIGWDKTGYSDGGNFPEIFAHEVGHNLNRWHAPCGNPASVDPSWPAAAAYASAAIGVYGYDVANNTLKSPTSFKDIMSYCTPLWVSDYTYQGILGFRASSPLGDGVNAASVAQDCLLVSGRIQDGQMVLDPAFKVTTVHQPPKPGAFTLQLQDNKGGTLLEMPFEPMEVADLPSGSTQHFVFTVPLSPEQEASLVGMRVLAGGTVQASRVASNVAANMVGVREPITVRMRPGQAHLSWDPMAHPKVMVRDPRTGEVLSFAEGGSLDLETDAPELEVTFSDGLRSTRRLLTVQ